MATSSTQAAPEQACEQGHRAIALATGVLLRCSRWPCSTWLGTHSQVLDCSRTCCLMHICQSKHEWRVAIFKATDLPLSLPSVLSFSLKLLADAGCLVASATARTTPRGPKGESSKGQNPNLEHVHRSRQEREKERQSRRSSMLGLVTVSWICLMS